MPIDLYGGSGIVEKKVLLNSRLIIRISLINFLKDINEEVLDSASSMGACRVGEYDHVVSY